MAVMDIAGRIGRRFIWRGHGVAYMVCGKMSIDLSINEVAQGLHAALGALFITFPVAMGLAHAELWGAGVGVLYAAIKEFWFDLNFETLEASGGLPGSVEDFVFYLVGMLGAAGLLHIVQWIKIGL